MSQQDGLPMEFFLFGGLVAATGLTLAAVALSRRKDAVSPPMGHTGFPAFGELDIEAVARMLSSENPRGSKELHVEQVWTQLRSLKPGQTLYERITAGSGWGAQGKAAQGGRRRPVSSEQPATEALRALARRVLAGLEPSRIPGAKSFFEPAQQDAAFRVAETARAKERQGEALTAKERRLLHYHFDAAGIRKLWGLTHRLGAIDGVEFYG